MWQTSRVCGYNRWVITDSNCLHFEKFPLNKIAFSYISIYLHIRYLIVFCLHFFYNDCFSPLYCVAFEKSVIQTKTLSQYRADMRQRTRSKCHMKTARLSVGGMRCIALHSLISDAHCFWTLWLTINSWRPSISYPITLYFPLCLHSVSPLTEPDQWFPSM